MGWYEKRGLFGLGVCLVMAATGCGGDGDDRGPLALALELPSPRALVSHYCLRNGREAELLLELASIAARFDALFRAFLPLAHASHRLQHAWDELWLAQDATVVAAIPLIAHEMSRLNWARARLTHLMDAQLRLLRSHAPTLRGFVEVNSTLAEELRMEGVERLAADKERLVDMERAIELRIRQFLEGSFDPDDKP